MADHKDPEFEVERILEEARTAGEATASDAVTAPEPEEEDIKIYEPKSREVEEGTPAQRQSTRVLDFVRRKADKEKSARRSNTHELPELEGQLTFEAMDEPEVVEAEPEVDPERELEERLQDVRREKVENFRLIQNEKEGFRLLGNEGESEEDIPLPEDDAVQEDYNSYAETAAVRAELKYRRRSGWVSLWFAALLEFVLLCVMLLTQFSAALPMEPIAYLTLNLALLIVLMLIAHRVIGGGLGGLVRLRATADTITAVAAFSAAIHTVLQYLNLTEVANGEVTLYNAVVGLALLLSLCGQQYRICRICRNFRLVSYKGDKFAAQCVTGARQTEQLGRFLTSLGTPEIVYMQKSGFLTHFMANSYDDEGHESLFKWFSPVVLLVSLAAAVVYTLLGGETANWWSAIGVFTALLTVSAPAFAVAGANLPLCRAAKRLLSRGAVLIGWKAVEQFDDVNGLVVEASDVFPSENVLLHGIKTFSGARIDEAILDAAAVSIEAGGPLAGVFRRVIENRLDMLQEVDTLLYEQEMGLSGWVGGRRVLVGNRRLLENHGVDVPSRDYEMRYTKDNRQLVYLSTGGELCAMFVVSYTADEGIAAALGQLEQAGITLMIRTCDPNVTQELVHEAFSVDEDAVRVLDTATGRVYDALTAEAVEQTDALLACNGRLEGLGTALSSCRRLRRRIHLTGVLQMVGAGLGLLFAAASLLVNVPIAPAMMVMHQLFWAFLTWLFAGFRWGD